MRIRKKIQSYSTLCVCARARVCAWCNRVIKVVVIQSGNQPCHKPFSAFHAKKVKEALRAILSGIKLLKKNICFIKKTHLVKTHLKSAGFSLLWKLVNMAIFISIIFLFEDGEQSTETGKFFPTFFCRKKLLETSVVTEAEIRKDLISNFTCI